MKSISSLLLASALFLGTVSAQNAPTVKDPVCGMSVDPSSAEKATYKGKTYYFCSKEDKTAFEKAPADYIKPEQSKKTATAKPS